MHNTDETPVASYMLKNPITDAKGAKPVVVSKTGQEEQGFSPG